MERFTPSTQTEQQKTHGGTPTFTGQQTAIKGLLHWYSECQIQKLKTLEPKTSTSETNEHTEQANMDAEISERVKILEEELDKIGVKIDQSQEIIDELAKTWFTPIPE